LEVYFATFLNHTPVKNALMKRIDPIKPLYPREFTLLPEDMLPPVQLNGGIVVAVTANDFNLGTTTLVGNLAKEFQRQNRKDNLKILFTDVTFSGDLSGLLNIPPDPHKGLNQLLGYVNESIDRGGIWSGANFSIHLTNIGRNIDVLPSFYYKDLFLRDAEKKEATGFDGMPALIRELRNHYDLIVIDIAPSRFYYVNMPLLSVCNYVITPYPLFPRGFRFGTLMETLLRTDRIVMKLKATGRPIEFRGIVPMFYLPGHRDHPKHLSLLTDSFGKYVWPVIPDKAMRRKSMDKLLAQGVTAGYGAVLNELIELKGRWPARMRNKTTREGAVKIINLLEDPLLKGTYDDFVKELELTRNQVISLFRKLSIFRNKGLDYCLQIYQEVQQAQRKDFSLINEGLAEIFKNVPRNDQP
jgi:cellulose biosynthesis protein BcsQ